MTKITLTATAGEVTATADFELPVDIPADQLQNVLKAIAIGMQFGWDKMIETCPACLGEKEVWNPEQTARGKCPVCMGSGAVKAGSLNPAK